MESNKRFIGLFLSTSIASPVIVSLIFKRFRGTVVVVWGRVVRGLEENIILRQKSNLRWRVVCLVKNPNIGSSGLSMVISPMPQGGYRLASQQKVDFRDFQTEPGLGYQGKFLDPSRKKDTALDRLGPDFKKYHISSPILIKYLDIRSPPSYPDSPVPQKTLWV